VTGSARRRPWLRWLAAGMIALLVGVASTGCGRAASGAGPAGPDAAPDPTLPAPAETVEPALPATTTGADGVEATVRSVERIVPLAGSLAEIVFALGLGDRVVARDVTATFAEVRDRPIVTKGHDVSAEAVLSLAPTVVLAQTDTGPPEALEQLRAAGVPVVVFSQPASVAEITGRIEAVAGALGVGPAGARVADAFDRELREVTARLPADRTPPRVAFLYLRGQAGVSLIGGPGSGADSVIAAAGGIDAGTAIGLSRPFTPITSEALVQAAPDVILMTTTGLESVGGIEGLLAIPGIAQTPAGRTRRVVTVEDGRLYSFGPRTPEVIREVADTLSEIPT